MHVRILLISVAALTCFALAPAHGKPPAAPVPHAGPLASPAPLGHPSRPVAVSHQRRNEHAELVRASVKPAPFVKRLASHPQLASRLQPLVPPGMRLQTAAAGFKNQGQFIAALHVSHNLGIPFGQLKAEMVRPDRDSLGQAIHELRPGVNATVAARRAENETKEDLTFARVRVNREKDRDDR